jgi:uncharacterized protein (TIGR00369 family)
MNPQQAPSGFRLLDRSSPLIEPWRPIYCQYQADRVVLGVFLRAEHTNSRGSAHGGFIAALADWAMGQSCGFRLHSDSVKFANLWTASLTVDYLGKAEPGQWLTFDTIFAKVGKTLCHAECDIAADLQTVARARAAFRVQLSDHVSSSS